MRLFFHIIGLIALTGLYNVNAKEDVISLSESCPPYFELTGEGVCRLRTLYQSYPRGRSEWGGYRVALPEPRDGFTPQQIDLGRLMFFDPILSAKGNISCAHCHNPALGLTDGRARSMGGKGKEMKRAAPSLWNLAFMKTFQWDSRANSLEEQIDLVIRGEDEMANTPEDVTRALNGIPAYRSLFQSAFGTKTVSYENIVTAIVAFEASLVSLNSRYDRYIHGARNALTEQELRGLHVFRSFASRCSQCHSPPLFTSNQLATIGLPTPDGLDFDPGAETVFNEPSLRGSFKVPSLRNILRTGPYMHAGQFSTIAEVIEFYNNDPGHAAPENEDLVLNWHIVNPEISEKESIDLAVFLATLTDETALPVIPDRVPSGLQVLNNKGEDL